MTRFPGLCSAGLALLAIVAHGLVAAEIPPFTVDTVLASLRSSHPGATRVPDTLPPGVKAFEEITYTQPGRHELKLDMYRPADAAVLPAVIIVHGGGWVAGDRTMERPFARNLAALGYVAVPVSYRLGTPGRFPAPIFDLKESIRWLRAHAAEYGIDSRQIGAVGGSAGGTLVSTLGVTNGQKEFEGPGGNAGISSDVQAVVNIDGTVTFMDNRLIEVSETQPSPYWEYVHGVYSQNRATWLAASPLEYVDRNSAPTFFIKSTVTQPILVGREEMASRLKLLGIDSGELQLPSTPHPFWLVHPWFEQTLVATDAFLRRHLKPRHSGQDGRAPRPPLPSDERTRQGFLDNPAHRARSGSGARS